MSQNARSVGFALIAVAALLGVAGLTFVYARLPLMTRGVQTTATVIDFKPAPGTGKPQLQDPILKYRDSAGTEHTFASDAGYAGRRGDVVSIRYDSRNPNYANVHSFWSEWLRPLICFAVAVLMLVAGRTLLHGKSLESPERSEGST